MTKQINLVWVGNGTISPLGCFNILGWMTCGWSITIYRHGEPYRNWGALIHPSVREHFVRTLFEAPFTVVPLADALRTANNGEGMPKTREVLRKWLSVPLEGLVGYAIADTTKSFIAGSVHGIVLDTKIGPSPHIYGFPQAVFENEFVSASRVGGMSGGVENQIAGSFNALKRTRYGQGFEMMARLLTANCEPEGLSPRTAEFVFGTATANHVMGFNRAAGVDLNKFSDHGENFEFVELRGSFAGGYTIPDKDAEYSLLRGEGDWVNAPQKNHGPFRVYQVAGFFNWRQGPLESRKNAVAVAYTLLCEHMRSAVPPPPFDRQPELYRTLIRPMVPEVVKSLLG